MCTKGLVVVCSLLVSSVATAAVPIVGGSTDMGDPEVVLIAFEYNDNGSWVGSLCTGTLIGTRTVLTAAHCADGTTRAHQVYFGYNPFGASDPTFLGLFDVELVQVHAGWNPNQLDAGNDIALLLIDGVAPIPPKPINRTAIGSSHVGDPVRIVGYGMTGPNDQSDPIKRQANTTLEEYNFNLIVDGSNITNTCQGDSGGPHFMTIGGVEVVVGVTSFGDSECSMYGAAGRVDFFAPTFIDPFLAQHDGGTPDPPDNCGNDGICQETGCSPPDPDCEDDPIPPDECEENGECVEDCVTRDPDCPLGELGEPCNGDADCESGMCIPAPDDPRIEYCSGECEPGAGDCLDGMDCVAATGGLHVCIWETPTPGALGSPCESNTQCIDRLCVQLGEDKICIAPCDDGVCPDGWSCNPASNGSEVCVPEADGGGDDKGCAVSTSTSSTSRNGSSVAWIVLSLLGLSLFFRSRSRSRSR